MKKVIVYTMDGCPHCTNFKNLLKESNIVFDERNVDKNEKEYEKFVEVTKNQFLPAFTLLEINDGEEPKIELNAPDDNFDNLNEALQIVKDFIL